MHVPQYSSFVLLVTQPKVSVMALLVSAIN